MTIGAATVIDPAPTAPACEAGPGASGGHGAGADARRPRSEIAAIVAMIGAAVCGDREARDGGPCGLAPAEVAEVVRSLEKAATS